MAPEGGWQIMRIATDDEGREIRVPLDRDHEYESWSRDLGIGSGGTIVAFDHGPMVAAEEELVTANIGSLALALSACALSPWATDSRLYVDRRQPPVQEDFPKLDERFHLDVADGSLVALVTRSFPARPTQSDEEMRVEAATIVAKYGCSVSRVVTQLVDGTPREALGAHDTTMSDASSGDRLDALYERSLDGSAHDAVISVSAEPSSRVGVLVDAARALADFFAALEGGVVTAATILNLCRAGRHNLLIGMSESESLEVKSAPYLIGQAGDIAKKAKVELSQDVARFANGSVDAILLVGFRESTNSGACKIDRHSPVRLDLIDPEQIRNVLDARVVPPLDGLVVEQFKTGIGEGLLAILVPKQPPELQPFLVHGAVVGGKLEGDFFSIVRRRGEGSITTTAQQVHAYIVAGKRYLRDK